MSCAISCSPGYGKRLDTHEVLADGTVLARFTDGTTEIADLLVGADGAGSAVRRQYLPALEPRHLGIRGGIGRTPLTDRSQALVPGWSTLVGGGDVVLFLGKMCFRRPPDLAAAELAPEIELPATQDYLRWVLLVTPGYSGDFPLIEEDQDRAITAVLDLIKDWHPELRALIADADRRNSGIAPLTDIGPIPVWPAGPVTLLGDAAHPMPPGGGGAALAVKDARLLRRRLTDVAGYEREMRAYAKAAREDILLNSPLGQFMSPAQ
jgi:2-polyprenyl-6-methoxyphenol hydroxylase-like FAD-dependent oxidoreductase